jgi:hypothetical protein
VPKITVIDRKDRFAVIVTFGRKKFHCGWKGGEFEHRRERYVLQGPHHGHQQYELYKLVPVQTELEEIR